MGLLKMDGFEGIAPAGTIASQDSTFDRRLGQRWLTANASFGTSTTSGKIVDGSDSRGAGLSLDWVNDNGHSMITALQDISSIVMGFAFKIGSNGVAFSGDIIHFRHATSKNFVIGFDSANRFYIKKAGGSIIVATSPALVKFQRWQYLEMKVNFANAPNGTAVVHLNGMEILNITGQDFQAVSSHAHSDNFYMDPLDEFVIDDMYFIDTTTPGLDDFLGPVVVHRLRPSADTATADFTPSEGSDHYAVVDNFRSDATDYLESSVVNDDELWDYEDVPSEIVTIKAINIETAASVTGSGVKEAASLCKSGSAALQEVSTITTIETLWEQFDGILEEDPDTSSPWTPAGLNAAQFGARHKS